MNVIDQKYHREKTTFTDDIQKSQQIQSAKFMDLPTKFSSVNLRLLPTKQRSDFRR